MPGRAPCPCQPHLVPPVLPETPDARVQALPESADLRFVVRPRGAEQPPWAGAPAGKVRRGLHAALQLAGPDTACLLPAQALVPFLCKQLYVNQKIKRKLMASEQPQTNGPHRRKEVPKEGSMMQCLQVTRESRFTRPSLPVPSQTLQPAGDSDAPSSWEDQTEPVKLQERSVWDLELWEGWSCQKLRRGQGEGQRGCP